MSMWLSTTCGELGLGVRELELTFRERRQLKVRGPEALRPAEWVQVVARDYALYLEEELLPRMGRGGIETLFVAGVTYPVVEDRCAFLSRRVKINLADLADLAENADLELSVNKYTEKEGAGPLPPLSRASHAHDIQTRRAMVSLFNASLKSFCARHPNVRFVDINPYIISPTLKEPNRVDSAFCDAEDPTNVQCAISSPRLPRN